MDNSKLPPSFSPSTCHRIVAQSIEPALGWRGGDVKSWQRRLRKQLAELLGLPRMPKPQPPRARTLWQREHPLGAISKIVLACEPGADAPAYVCLPRGVEPPYPFLICVQGHSTGMHNSIAVKREDEDKPLYIAGDRDFGLGCLRHGVAALCLEQRSFGERRELQQKARCPDRMCHDAAMHAIQLGRTLIGERVYDVDRALDYLAARGDADMRCVGVMGNSGGGTTSLFAAAVLPRLRFAMPSCYFCTFRDSILSIYHCECNYVPGLSLYAEMADILGLFAPNPVVVVAGEHDGIFPIRAVRREFQRLKAIYRAAGAADRCHLVVGKEGHRFYELDAWPVLLREMRRIRAYKK